MRTKLDRCMVTGCRSDRRPLVLIGARFYCQDCAAPLVRSREVEVSREFSKHLGVPVTAKLITSSRR